MPGIDLAGERRLLLLWIILTIVFGLIYYLWPMPTLVQRFDRTYYEAYTWARPLRLVADKVPYVETFSSNETPAPNTLDDSSSGEVHFGYVVPRYVSSLVDSELWVTVYNPSLNVTLMPTLIVRHTTTISPTMSLDPTRTADATAGSKLSAITQPINAQVLLREGENRNDLNTSSRQAIELGPVRPRETVTRLVWARSMPLAHAVTDNSEGSDLAADEPNSIYLFEDDSAVILLQFKFYMLTADGNIGQEIDVGQGTSNAASSTTISMQKTVERAFVRTLLLPPWANGLLVILALVFALTTNSVVSLVEDRCNERAKTVKPKERHKDKRLHINRSDVGRWAIQLIFWLLVIIASGCLVIWLADKYVICGLDSVANNVACLRRQYLWGALGAILLAGIPFYLVYICRDPNNGLSFATTWRPRWMGSPPAIPVAPALVTTDPQNGQAESPNQETDNSVDQRATSVDPVSETPAPQIEQTESAIVEPGNSVSQGADETIHPSGSVATWDDLHRLQTDIDSKLSKCDPSSLRIFLPGYRTRLDGIAAQLDQLPEADKAQFDSTIQQLYGSYDRLETFAGEVVGIERMLQEAAELRETDQSSWDKAWAQLETAQARLTQMREDRYDQAPTKDHFKALGKDVRVQIRAHRRVDQDLTPAPMESSQQAALLEKLSSFSVKAEWVRTYSDQDINSLTTRVMEVSEAQRIAENRLVAYWLAGISALANQVQVADRQALEKLEEPVAGLPENLPGWVHSAIDSARLKEVEARAKNAKDNLSARLSDPLPDTSTHDRDTPIDASAAEQQRLFEAKRERQKELAEARVDLDRQLAAAASLFKEGGTTDITLRKYREAQVYVKSYRDKFTNWDPDEIDELDRLEMSASIAHEAFSLDHEFPLGRLEQEELASLILRFVEQEKDDPTHPVTYFSEPTLGAPSQRMTVTKALGFARSILLSQWNEKVTEYLREAKARLENDPRSPREALSWVERCDTLPGRDDPGIGIRLAPTRLEAIEAVRSETQTAVRQLESAERELRLVERALAPPAPDAVAAHEHFKAARDHYPYTPGLDEAEQAIAATTATEIPAPLASIQTNLEPEALDEIKPKLNRAQIDTNTAEHDSAENERDDDPGDSLQDESNQSPENEL